MLDSKKYVSKCILIASDWMLNVGVVGNATATTVAVRALLPLLNCCPRSTAAFRRLPVHLLPQLAVWVQAKPPLSALHAQQPVGV